MEKIKKHKLTIIAAFCFGLLLPLSIALTPAGQWVGNTVAGIGDFLADGSVPLTGDLDTGNNDIKMGTGLIGYNGTAAKGLSFDSGNEKVTLNSGQLLLPNGTKTTPVIAPSSDPDTGIYFGIATIYISISNTTLFTINNNSIYSSDSNGFSILHSEAASATNPVFANRADTDTGTGTAGADMLSHITGGRETMRMISFADADVADNEVVVTGVSEYHGLVLVRSLTDDTSAIYRVSNITVIDVSLDGDHTSTVTTAGHYNFYYDTDQFKLENKAGAGKSVSVAFWVLPT